ncbi:S-layer homology domain-containing protein [Ornithinibacillus californiensis]|uniref:S-layer homology domain-containing protein n=1 Tax=Ornithinibacillus californiensis TaxID=161536 RepID=UPI00069DCCF6|nr:S-layer homology domain-containing protein [Ornithinibacillus californiensis]
MLKRIRNTITTAVVIASAATIAIPNISYAYTKEFDDVKKDKSHYEAIMELTEAGIINGYGDGTFGYTHNLERRHSAVLFTNAMKLPIPNDVSSILESYYTDVDEDDMYADQIAAVTPGIFSGGGGLFNPNQNLTRQQMATTIVKAFGLQDNGTDPGIKLDNVYESHRENVKVLAQHKITNQLGDFRPGDPITRAQFATFLYLAMIETGQLERPVKDDEELVCEIPDGATAAEIAAIEEECEPPTDGETGTKTIVHYDFDYSSVVELQANRTPKMDGAGKFTASEKAVSYYLNPGNFSDETSPEYYQFLKLSNTPGFTAKELNDKILAGKGKLSGTGQAFIEASETYNTNVIYLIAHALHETGNGASDLSRGVEVGIDANNKHQLVTSSNRDKLINIQTTYNMFGIGAIDSDPLKQGAFRAYREGWFTPELAIIGGARFISNGYIGSGQDTLYKMRWNPDNPGDHQYATHVMWSVIQAREIYDMYTAYDLSNYYALTFEIPEYTNQPAKTAKPVGDEAYAIDNKLAGALGVTTERVNIRVAPGTSNAKIRTTEVGEKITVIGENGGWFKVKTDQETGWMTGDYIDFKNILQVKADSDGLRIRTAPVTGTEIGKINSHDYILGILDNEDKFVKQEIDGVFWYKVLYAGKEGWVSGDFLIEK